MPYGNAPGQGYNDPVNNRIVVVAPGKNQGIFVYSPTAGTGNLVVSIAAVSGTDQYGNAYLGPGIEIQGAGDTGQKIFLGLVGSIAELQMYTGEAIEGAVANLFTSHIGSGVGEFLQTGFSGPKLNVAGSQDWVQLQLNSSQNGNGPDSVMNFVYINNAQVANTWMELGPTGVAFFNDIFIGNTSSNGSSNTGANLFVTATHLKYEGSDANQYATGRLTLVCTGQTIPANTATPITGLSCNVVAGNYKFQAHIVFNGNVAARIGNAISAPATSGALVSYLWFNAGGAVAVSQATSTALGTGVLGPTMTAANQVLKIEGFASFTTSGTFALEADTSIAADNLNILFGSTLDMYPVP